MADGYTEPFGVRDRFLEHHKPPPPSVYDRVPGFLRLTDRRRTRMSGDSQSLGELKEPTDFGASSLGA